MHDEILFTSQEVAGCTIKPWTLGQIVKLCPVFECLFDEFKSRGIAPTNILTTIQTDPFKVLSPCINHISSILVVTTGKTIEDIESLQIGETLKIVIVIIQQNIEYLKNAFGPVNEMIAQLTGN